MAQSLFAHALQNPESKKPPVLLGVSRLDLLARSFGLNACPYFDGGGEGSRTPVRNSSDQTSTRVVRHSSRTGYADARAYPNPSVRFGSLQRASGASCSEIC